MTAGRHSKSYSRAYRAWINMRSRWMTQPVRLQLSRRKGFDLQKLSIETNGLAAIVVARPRRWGNDWRIGDRMFDESIGDFRSCVTVDDCVQAFRNCVDWDPETTWTAYAGSSLICRGGFGPHHRNRKTARAELAGKNLACWCKVGVPCHADVLLELANSGWS